MRRCRRFQPGFHFNPLPPHGGRRPNVVINAICAAFQSTPSAWRETGKEISQKDPQFISIHSLRMEGDPLSDRCQSHMWNFNPLPPHGGRPAYESTEISARDISIHSLRMEGDRRGDVFFADFGTFQSTPSAWRETCEHRLSDIEEALFQSTPSAWRETTVQVSPPQCDTHFNPLPPHGGRLDLVKKHLFQGHISIHSLRMEGDNSYSILKKNGEISIHSLRMEGDPTLVISSIISEIISIHSLRMEGDAEPLHGCLRPIYFNPLPPHGGRHSLPGFIILVSIISIHSLRMEGDSNNRRRTLMQHISIHSLRMEGDCQVDAVCSAFHISIHSLRMEGDGEQRETLLIVKKFQSTPSAWRETACNVRRHLHCGISIHSLRMEGDSSNHT